MVEKTLDVLAAISVRYRFINAEVGVMLDGLSRSREPC